MERHNVGSRQISVHLNALLQARAIYKKRLDDVAMLEKHITQARARDIAETEHATKQGRLHVVEAPVKLPPGRCEVCVCVSAYLSASASTAVGIVLYPCHCPFLNIGRASCEHDSQPVQNTLVCMVP